MTGDRNILFSTGSASFACRHFVAGFLILAGCQWYAPAALALAQQVSRVQDIADLKVGQRIKVDDGTCPAGQIKEISGTKMSPSGVVRSQKCVPRFGPKQGTSAAPPRP